MSAHPLSIEGLVVVDDRQARTVVFNGVMELLRQHCPIAQEDLWPVVEELTRGAPHAALRLDALYSRLIHERLDIDLVDGIMLLVHAHAPALGVDVLLPAMVAGMPEDQRAQLLQPLTSSQFMGTNRNVAERAVRAHSDLASLGEGRTSRGDALPRLLVMIALLATSIAVAELWNPARAPESPVTLHGEGDAICARAARDGHVMTCEVRQPFLDGEHGMLDQKAPAVREEASGLGCAVVIFVDAHGVPVNVPETPRNI